MKFTVNYNRHESLYDGTVKQTVTIECTEIELGYINYRVRKNLEDRKSDAYNRLFEGTQLVSIDMMQALKDAVCNKNNRVKADRQTFVQIKLTQRKKMNRDGECVTCEHATPNVKYCTLHNIEIYQDNMSCEQWAKAKVRM